jgi:chromosome segregation ATPase
MTDDFATIIPIFLEDSELEYELRIRKLRGQNTRDSRVKTLERALAKSRTVVQDPEFTLENEKKLIDDTLETIKTTISTLEAEISVDSNIYKRISTRIAYITQRILRVSKNIKTTSEINDLIENWEAQCLELEADLIIKTKTSIREVPSHMSLQSVGSNSSTKSVPVHGTMGYPFQWSYRFDSFPGTS